METKDLNYAAFLVAKKQELIDSKPDKEHRFYFYFEDSEDLEALNKGYYMNTEPVLPQDFINAQKNLKNLIRNYKI
jgi:hypothetical protein